MGWAGEHNKNGLKCYFVFVRKLHVYLGSFIPVESTAREGEAQGAASRAGRGSAPLPLDLENAPLESLPLDLSIENARKVTDEDEPLCEKRTIVCDFLFCSAAIASAGCAVGVAAYVRVPIHQE